MTREQELRELAAAALHDVVFARGQRGVAERAVDALADYFAALAPPTPAPEEGREWKTLAEWTAPGRAPSGEEDAAVKVLAHTLTWLEEKARDAEPALYYPGAYRRLAARLRDGRENGAVTFEEMPEEFAIRGLALERIDYACPKCGGHWWATADTRILSPASAHQVRCKDQRGVGCKWQGVRSEMRGVYLAVLADTTAPESEPTQREGADHV